MTRIAKKIKTLTSIEVSERRDEFSENAEQLTLDELNQVAGSRDFACPGPRPNLSCNPQNA
jgi:hypothetical protein